MMLSRAALSGVVILVAMLALDVSHASAAPVTERRALFAENFDWVTRRGADKMISRAKRAGFNALVICVWHGRGTSWPSELAPREKRWEASISAEADPLAYFIRQAHAEGLEVHAWFTVALRQREMFPQYYDGVGVGGEVKLAFNLHRPEFRNYIVQVMREALQKYEFDGINLDYIRTMGVCTSPYCQQRYRAERSRDLLEDVRLRHDSKAAWNSVSAWNAGAVTDIVRRTAIMARRERPGLLISVDSHIGKRELELEGADSASWVNQGLVDVIYDMNYQASFDMAEVTSEFIRVKDPRRVVLLVGNFDRSLFRSDTVFPREASRVAELMQVSERFGRGGFGSGLYAYEYLSDAQIELLQRTSVPKVQ